MSRRPCFNPKAKISENVDEMMTSAAVAAAAPNFHRYLSFRYLFVAAPQPTATTTMMTLIATTEPTTVTTTATTKTTRKTTTMMTVTMTLTSGAFSAGADLAMRRSAGR